MAYQEEIDRIRKKIGGLEAIRNHLGLTRRQICEFLLVDPSAWSRWVSGEKETAPPHVYRTLELMMDLKPAPKELSLAESNAHNRIHWNQDLQGTSLSAQNLDMIQGDLRAEVQQSLKSHFDALKSQVLQKEELKMGWKLLLLLNIVLVLYALFR